MQKRRYVRIVMIILVHALMVCDWLMKGSAMGSATYFRLKLGLANNYDILYIRHIGGRDLVPYRKVVPTWRLTCKPHPSIPRLDVLKGVACGRRISDFYAAHQNHPRWNKLEEQKIKSTF